MNGVVAVVAVVAFATATVEPAEFRMTRALEAPSGAGPIAFDADASLFAHAGPGFATMRIVDTSGEQVPWRPYPRAPAPQPRRVPTLDRGRSDGAAVALLDLGPRRLVRTQVDLDLPARGFVGTATVWGSDDRRTLTRLGSSRVFDLAGAEGRARSTTVSFPPSDFRYLRLRVTGVARIDGALVSTRPNAAAPVPIARRVRGRVIDLGGANTPVDALRIGSSATRYVRSVRVEARNPGEPWQQVVRGRVFRLYGTPSPPLVLGIEARYLRVTIANGDDPPLADVRLEPLARPRTILVEGGHSEPLRLLYGGRERSAPSYEFARLPRNLLALDHVRRGRLGTAEANAAFEPASDTRSWVKRHSVVIDAALAAAAAALVVAGVLALRRRT